jgi:hypothetical protein
MYLYCVRNKINSKRYIGITKSTIEHRRDQHIHEAFVKKKKFLFYNALRKYGKENFEFEWIKNYTGLITYNELKEIEKDTIFKYKTYVGFENNQGYNLTLGGEGRSNEKFINIVQCDKNTTNIINTFRSTVEAKDITGINNILKCLNKTRKSAGGFMWFYENEVPIRYKRERDRTVEQRDKNTLLIATFNTIKKASDITNVNKDSIRKVCLNKGITAGGFIWNYKD